jgi:RNA polymerase sigma-70 factor, ECF subfamily
MTSASVSTGSSGLDLAELDGYRPGLLGYCYRMLGSVFEAEDAAQETMMRAWQGGASFEGRAALRTWLYRIATNVCTDILRGRSRRAMPMDLGPSVAPQAFEDARFTENPWMSPIPDRDDPAEVAVSRESIRLAFVAALQHLPPRQRAVLILRDVLSWPAAEVATLLETSVASVNSALQRARAALPAREPAQAAGHELTDGDRELVANYVDAFERYDIDALVRLLHDDAIQSMPPIALWLRGAADIGRFMLGPGSACRGSRLVPVRANGCPAFGQYKLDENGVHRPWALQVLELRDGRIAGLHCFVDNSLDNELFATFGLPATLER